MSRLTRPKLQRVLFDALVYLTVGAFLGVAVVALWTL